jgi:ABC-type nitrate/sulfonate/bicarbonate transport system substrate-binding protein
MNRRISALVIWSLAAVLAPALAGCGTRKERTAPASTKTVRLALAPLNVGENAVFAAQRENYFVQAGLKAQLNVSADPRVAIRKLQQGQADLAIVSEPDLLEARGKGAGVVSVATLVQSPFTSLIGPKLSFGALADLATKPIGTQGLDYQRAMAQTIFARAGGRARVVTVGGDLTQALTTKTVAAVIAPFGGPTLPSNVVSRPVDQLGVPPFSEYVLVANEAALGRDADDIRGVVTALARGTRMLASSNGFGTSIPVQGAQVARFRALMQPPPGKPYGWHDAAKWRAFGTWMKANHLPVKSAGAFTNRFLAGQGL